MIFTLYGEVKKRRKKQVNNEKWFIILSLSLSQKYSYFPLSLSNILSTYIYIYISVLFFVRRYVYIT